MMRTLLEEEVERLAGVKHKHNPDRQGLRWGKEESHVVSADARSGSRGGVFGVSTARRSLSSASDSSRPAPAWRGLSPAR